MIDISSDDDEEQIPAKRTKHADSTNCNDPKPTIAPNSLPLKAANGQATPEEVAVPQEHVTTSSSVSFPAVLKRIQSFVQIDVALLCFGHYLSIA